MPFMDDTGPSESDLRHPVWSAFALAKDNLERIIVLNLFWSIQILPALLAFAFPLWLPVRIILALGSATALAAATGVLYGMTKYVCEAEPLSLDLLRETYRDLAVPGMLRLAPLYGTWGLGLMGFTVADALGIVILQIFFGYLICLLVFLSFYWGPLFADNPQLSSWILLKRSARLVWRYPSVTITSALVILILLLTGVASIAGILLIVPVLVALLQTRRYQEVAHRERERANRRAAREAAIEISHS